MLRGGGGDLRQGFSGFTVPTSSHPIALLAVHAKELALPANLEHHLLQIVVQFEALLRDSCGRQPTSQG